MMSSWFVVLVRARPSTKVNSSNNNNNSNIVAGASQRVPLEQPTDIMIAIDSPIAQANPNSIEARKEGNRIVACAIHGELKWAQMGAASAANDRHDDDDYDNNSTRARVR